MANYNVETRSPNIEEVLNDENSERFITSHIIVIMCDCGNEWLQIRYDGYNDRFECENCGEGGIVPPYNLSDE